MNFDKRIKEYRRKSDEAFGLFMRIKGRQGYVFRALDGCSEPNYEVIKR